MRKLASLLWKEWHETRLFLWIGLGTFLGLPFIRGLEGLFQYSRRLEISTSPWVMLFGGAFALFVAVGTTSRDLSTHLEDFWRSRPVSVTRWFLVKYAVGLAIALCVCVLPLLAEQWLNRDDAAPLAATVWMPFLWAALYTVAFASGCLIRRPAHAAMLALAGMLLIYFLPTALPPLRALNVADIVDARYDFRAAPILSPSALIFAAGMAAITMIMLAVALAAVRFQWRIEAGRRLMFGAVSSVILIIFATTGYKLGTNLPILQQVGIPAGERVISISCDGHRGIVTTVLTSDEHTWRFRSLELTTAGFQLGEPKETVRQIWNLLPPEPDSPPGHPEIFYEIDNLGDENSVDYRLLVGRVDRDRFFNDYWGLSLWHEDVRPDNRPQIYIWGQRLYVIGDYLATVDISDPMSPRLISQVPFSFRYSWVSTTRLLVGVSRSNPGDFTLQLPPVPGLPKEERLKAALAAYDWSMGGRPPCFDGDILCADLYGQIAAWRLATLTDESAVFATIGQYQQTVLDQIFGSFANGPMSMCNGLLYLDPSYSQNGNPRVTVFDLHSPHPLRPVGHFAAPGIRTVCPLPDGRALVGGSQLWLVGPPPSRR